MTNSHTQNGSRHFRDQIPRSPAKPSAAGHREQRIRTAILILMISLTALGVRLLAWHTARAEAATVQTGVVANYKLTAQLLNRDGWGSFFRPGFTVNTPDLFGHPPGYPFLLALVYRAYGESDAVVQFLQIIGDMCAIAILFLIAMELLPTGVAAIAAFMAAVAPQFAWNLLPLLPDTLAVLPILLAVYLLVRARTRPRASQLVAAGVLIGLSCLLRPNALLLTPFIAFFLPALFPSKMHLGLAAVFLGGAILIIAPLTIRNAVLFRQFIPLSLGAGQTLLEGIADYDTHRSLGIPDTDVEIAKMEAEEHGRPDYANTLFGPDGVQRDRARLSRGIATIRAHPIWFTGVMIQRAASMLRMERVPLTSLLTSADDWTHYPAILLRSIQLLFRTAIMLPLVIVGGLILARRRQWQTLAILLMVPTYYLLVQSALHTEYRYVLAIHYFLFVLAAVAIYQIALAWREG